MKILYGDNLKFLFVPSEILTRQKRGLFFSVFNRRKSALIITKPRHIGAGKKAKKLKGI